jgi:AraC-like DNA-binding protein
MNSYTTTDTHNYRGMSSSPSSTANGSGYVSQSPSRNGEDVPRQRAACLSREAVAASLESPLLRGLIPVSAGSVQSAENMQGRLTGMESALFVYCTKGRGWCDVEGRRYEIRAGDLVVILPRLLHGYGASDTRSWNIYWVRALGTNLDHFLAELSITARNPVLSLGESPQLLALFQEVFDALEGSRTPARLLYAAQALAHLLATIILRRRESGRSEPDICRKIDQTIAYMQQHLDKPLHVAALAALANVSPSYYTLLFKRQTGSAPMNYFIRLRMQHAQHLLEATPYSVKEVAAALGYDDPLYFSRIFKSVSRVAPTQYRLQRRREKIQPLQSVNSPCPS